MSQISTRIAAAGALLLALAAAPAFAQQASAAPQVPAAPQPPQPVVVYQGPSTDANDTQRQLQDLLRQYPPSLRQVLQIDPTLMNRPDYLQPYPALVAFLQQHPEIAHNPSYFFGQPDFQRLQSERSRGLAILRDVAAAFFFLCGFVVTVSLIYSLLRQAVDYRRWRRQVQIQTEVHTKLFDRLTGQQELLAYIESPATRRFLESAPASIVRESPAMLAPLSRILWSVQIGIVVAAIGSGFWLARGAVDDLDVTRVMTVMGTLAIAVGIGFIISAMVSWALSVRFGLLAPGAKAES